MKTKILIPSIAVATLAGTLPLVSISSCGKSINLNPLTDELWQESVDCFTGAEDEPGICDFPHASLTDDLKTYEEYMFSWVKSQGVSVDSIWKDDYGNIWYDLPASQGCEDWPALVLQGHLDMVWTTKPDVEVLDHPEIVFDTLNNETVIHTIDHKTSLGADDGQGIAIMMAITKNKNIKHGPLRMIMTADEEPGMLGAAAIGKKGAQTINVVDPSKFNYLLNLDGENENEMFVSCAGGRGYRYEGENLDTVAPFASGKQYLLHITGGKGGHSGMAIENRHANAIKLAAEALKFINTRLGGGHGENYNIELVDVNSHEEAANVVPGATDVQFVCSSELSSQDINDTIAYLQQIIYEKHPSEDEITFAITAIDQKSQNVLNQEQSYAIADALYRYRYGLLQADPTDGRVLTSSNICPATLTIDEGKANYEIKVYSRSEIYSDLMWLDNFAKDTYDQLLKTYIPSSESEQEAYFDPWPYNPDDTLRKLTQNAFAKINIYPKEAKIHGGIESSWWYKFNPAIQQASIGATVDDVHHYNETFHLGSFRHIASVVLDVLEGMEHMEHLEP